MASGRVWNYFSDSFDYNEDNSSTSGTIGSYTTSSIERILKHNYNKNEAAPLSKATQFLGTERSMLSTHVVHDEQQDFDEGLPVGSGCESKSEVQQVSGGNAGDHCLNSRGNDCNGILNEPERCFDHGTTHKVSGLLTSYEALLEAQLLDQQLHYEKLLAREAVRVLELSHRMRLDERVKRQESNSKSYKHKNKSKKTNTASNTAAQKDCHSLDEGSPALTQTVDTTCCMERTTDAATDDEEEVAIVADLLVVEQLKIQISALEADFQQVREEVRVAEEEKRTIMKRNEVLIKLQRAQEAKVAQLVQEEISLRSQCEEQISDMEQTIRDLSFAARTRQEVAQSPLREEVLHGKLLVEANRSELSTSGKDHSSNRQATRGRK